MKYTVLIVDDSKLARMAVIKALNSLHPDWVRLEAASADEALERIRLDSPNMVLLDFNMPGKDGLTLAGELHQSHPHVSVAVISANRQIEIINQTHACGATFLAKPLTEKALGEFLDAAAKMQATKS